MFAPFNNSHQIAIQTGSPSASRAGALKLTQLILNLQAFRGRMSTNSDQLLQSYRGNVMLFGKTKSNSMMNSEGTQSVGNNKEISPPEQETKRLDLSG